MQTKNHKSEMTAHKSRHFFFILDILFPALLLAFCTVIFRITNLDMQIQAAYFKLPAGWYLKDLPLVNALYSFGNYPALALSIGSLVLLGLGYHKHKYIKWRKIGFFLIITMVLAPGLIINTLLKDQWGRPRPRNVKEFGGKFNYEKVLTYDASSTGKSFPCGHASMGFFLFVPWFILRKKHPKSAVLVLFTGIAAGTAIGWARLVQGGHFASDVIWSGMLVYITAAIVFYIFRIDHTIWYYPAPSDIPRRHRTVIQFTFGILILIFILGVVLATPYEKVQTNISGYRAADSVSFIHHTVYIDEGEVNILPGTQLKMVNSTSAFGFPGSRIRARYRETLAGTKLTGKYTQSVKGFFTEKDNVLRVTYPTTDSLVYKLEMDKGTVQMTIPEDFVYLDVQIEIHEGSLILDIPAKFKPVIDIKGDNNLIDKTGFKSDDGIFINPAFKLTILVHVGEVTLK